MHVVYSRLMTVIHLRTVEQGGHVARADFQTLKIKSSYPEMRRQERAIIHEGYTKKGADRLWK